MSDDSFIREVDEELRSERVQNFWSRYGKILMVLAAAFVLLVAGYRYYEYSKTSAAAKAGDAFMSAVRLAENGKTDEALEALKQIEGEGSEAYKTMAAMRLASELATKGEIEAAIEKFDAVASDSSANENMKAIARIRAGLLLVDSGTATQVEARVGPLSAPGAPYRTSAWEAMGLAYYKAGDLEKAFEQFDKINKELEAPADLRQRVRIMLDVIASQGGPVSEKNT